MRHFLILLVAAGLFGALTAWADSQPVAASQIPVTFSGGHETDPHDRGRPVILVAGALQVPPQVFRDAFSQVHPAPAGQAPAPDQVQRNKAVLMNALAPYGVTNERLDAVSNRYRYVRSRGEKWPIAPAVAFAIVTRGVVTGFTVTDGGYGYSSPPQVSLPGFPLVHAEVHLTFGPDFTKNGSVQEIVLVPSGK